MPISHNAPPALPILELGMSCPKCLHLGLDHLLQHPPRAIPQHQQQRIVTDTRPWPCQTNNRILSHGVSFLVTSNITEDTPPHPSSTKFGYSPWSIPPVAVAAVHCSGSWNSASWAKADNENADAATAAARIFFEMFILSSPDCVTLLSNQSGNRRGGGSIIPCLSG
jgi:hypothetical protein